MYLGEWGGVFLETIFNKVILEHEAKLKKVNIWFDFFGYCKLLLVVLLGISGYFLFDRNLEFKFLILVLLELPALVFFWVYHSVLQDKITYSKDIISINKRYLCRINGGWTSFPDIGEEFIAVDHPYGCDLDIVGRKSLFQLLNITNTWHGRQAFANDLLSPDYSKSQLQERQEAILELSGDICLLNDIEFHASKIGPSESVKNLVSTLTNKSFFIKSRGLKFFLSYFPVLSLGFIFALIVLEAEELYILGIGCVTFQVIVWLVGMVQALRYVGEVNFLPDQLKAYAEVIKTINAHTFTSPKLQEIKAKLGASNFSAEQAIKDLGKISDKLIVRNQATIGLVLNVFCFWDYKCAFMLEKWKQKYADLAEEWFLALGEFESLMSFSTLGVVCSQVCLPDISGQNQTVKALSLGHPLLSNADRITNDVDFTDSIFIISGSNMSGKTTFLRTVGINLVLGQSGGFVCATQMTLSKMKIITSMRISDDLNEGVSTFYAELKRIKSILELGKKGCEIMFLIDEIFRGTNSVDRLSGAQAVIGGLNEFGASGIITTHDLELCDLANQYPRVKNYNFSEYYKDNQIYFDYKMKPNKSTATNARYLMEMLGIILK